MKPRFLFVSTPVGPLGSGIGGGVELSLSNLAQEMTRRGHHLKIVAPQGSRLEGYSLIEVAGSLQVSAQNLPRDALPQPGKASVLSQMWKYVEKVCQNYELIINFAYDALPFEFSSQLKTPIAHLVSMASLNDYLDEKVRYTARVFPGTVGFYSRAQAETFGLREVPILENGLDFSRYQFCETPDSYLCWMGRISPEKGLEDALRAAQLKRKKLKVLGFIHDEVYWEEIQKKDFKSSLSYEGFLPTPALQEILRKAQALLVTPHWVEAFGNVVMEALACGVPVIAYQRGGPAEIVKEGKTGFLVPPDCVEALAAAISKVGQIDRKICRAEAEKRFSMEVWGNRMEKWFYDILKLS